MFTKFQVGEPEPLTPECHCILARGPCKKCAPPKSAGTYKATKICECHADTKFDEVKLTCT